MKEMVGGFSILPRSHADRAGEPTWRCLLEPLCQALNSHLAGIGRDDSELVATEANEKVAPFTHRLFEPIGEVAQQSVARQVTVSVVYPLETVDVDHGQ